jgi:hypothetical protein
MGFGDRLKRAIQIVVGGHSVGRTVVKGATINSGAYRPKQGEEWLHAYNTMPWLRANVAKIAGGVAGLEWGITRTMDDNGMTVKRPDLQRGGYEYRKKVLAAMEDEEKAEATFDHPFLTLLKNPCPALPGKAALILAQVYYEVVGEVFFVVDRGSRDEWLLKSKVGRPLPTALWPIPPTWVKRVPTPDQPTFEIRQSGLQMNDIPLTEVLWLKNPDPVNPYARGVGLFNSLTDELDSDENAAKMIAYSFYNRNRPDVLVSLPGADEVELRAFRNDWVSSLQGVTNALKNHFVNVEAKVEQLGYDFREMQVIDLRRHTRDTIRQVPGMPPEILGIQDQSNRATIDAAEYIFAKHVIVPRAEIWRDFWQTQVVVEYDDRAILDYVTPVQEDKNFTLNIVTGRPEVVKVNEIRKLGGLPALTDEEGGNLFFVNGSFVPTLVPPAAGPPMPGAEAGAGVGLSIPGFEGGINVPGAAQMHLSVPGAAGSAASGLPATVGAPQGPPGSPPPTPPAGGPGAPPAPPAPDGNGPGYTLAGRPQPPEDEEKLKTASWIVKIHNPHVVDEGDGTFKVIDSDGKVYGTHDSEADAEAQVAALYAAKKRGKSKGVAVRTAARNFRPRTLAAAEVTPDEAILISKWFAANDYEVNPSAILKTAPIPLTDDRATEWLRRSMAYLAGTPTKSWDAMFGPWTQHDTDLVDTILKGDYEGHPFRGNQWTGGVGGGEDDVEESVAPWALTDSRLHDVERSLNRLDTVSRVYGEKPLTKFRLSQFLTLPENHRIALGPRQWDGVRKDAERILGILDKVGLDKEKWLDEFAKERGKGRYGEGYVLDTLEGMGKIEDIRAGLEQIIAVAKDARGASAERAKESRESAKAQDNEMRTKLPGLSEIEVHSSVDAAKASLGKTYYPDQDGPRGEGSDHTGGPEVNFKGMDPVIASFVADEALTFKQEFPEAYDALGYLGMGTVEDRVKPGTMAHFRSGHVTTVGFDLKRGERLMMSGRAVYSRSGGVRQLGEGESVVLKYGVALNGTLFSSAAEAYRAHGVESASDFHDGMKDIRSTVRHEFAHHIDRLAKDTGYHGIEAWKQKWAGRSREISGYATENLKELLAESYSAMRYGDDTRRNHPAVRELEDVMKDFRAFYRAKRGSR